MKDYGQIVVLVLLLLCLLLWLYARYQRRIARMLEAVLIQTRKDLQAIADSHKKPIYPTRPSCQCGCLGAGQNVS